MKYNDILETFSILHGFKRYLLSKEEIMQLINETDRDEYFNRIRTIFKMKENIKSIEELEDYFYDIKISYAKKINGFIKLNILKYDVLSMLDFKNEFEQLEYGFDIINKINEQIGLLKDVQWENRAFFLEWADFIFTIYSLRLKNNYGYEKHSFQMRKVVLNTMNYNTILDSIFSDDQNNLRTLFHFFKDSFEETALQEIFENGKIIFYSFLLKKIRLFSLDDIPTMIFGVFLLFIRQSDFLLASLNAIEMNLDKDKLGEMLI
ncbi:hypothetical protein J7L48_06935 [bacterium]|nr:hypothetical protein [bacterium]